MPCYETRLVVAAFHKHGDGASRNRESSGGAGEGCGLYDWIGAAHLDGVEVQAMARVVGDGVGDRIGGCIGYHDYAAITVVQRWADLVGDGIGDEAWHLPEADVVELQTVLDCA